MTTWRVATELGIVEVELNSAGAITRLDYAREANAGLTSVQSPEDAEGDRVPPVVREAARQVEEYFRGERTELELPYACIPARGTEFERRVWSATAAIPRGQTRTYGEIAAAIGSPKASRAVGAALGRNPLMIAVPCHRVVGADGTLTGYAGGVEVKRTLLAVEGAAVDGAGSSAVPGNQTTRR